MKKNVAGVFFVSFLFFVSPVHANVYINELSTYTTDDDWIELYSNTTTDISGWVIKDETGIIKTIDDGIVLGSSGYYSINVINRLNKDGDRMTLYDKDLSLIDELNYGNKGGPCVPNDPNQSVGRETDGNSTLIRFQMSTKDATNNDAPKEPCPTPSPTPASTNIPTPSPTRTPTNTLTPQPTKSPTPSPTKLVTPTKTPSPTPTKGTGESTELVLGETISITPTPAIVKTKSSTVAVGAKVFLILGLLFLGVAIITFTYKMQVLPKDHEKI